jgi:hypothetical protein
MHGSHQAADLLLRRNPEVVKELDGQQQTPLHHLFYRGDFVFLKEVLRQRALSPCGLTPNGRGHSLAFLTLTSRNLELLQIILEVEKDWYDQTKLSMLYLVVFEMTPILFHPVLIFRKQSVVDLPASSGLLQILGILVPSKCSWMLWISRIQKT